MFTGNEKRSYIQGLYWIDSSDIVYAACGCPAGKGPRGSCKHIAALTYGFCKIFESQTCTDVLQKWNKPRAKKNNPIPVDELGSRRRELTNSSRRANVLFDPQPLSLRKESTTALEKLRCDLLGLPQQCALVTILIPSVEKIQLVDHCYTSLTIEDKPSENWTNGSHTLLPIVCPYSDEEKRAKVRK